MEGMSLHTICPVPLKPTQMLEAPSLSCESGCDANGCDKMQISDEKLNYFILKKNMQDILACNYITYFNTTAASEWFEDVGRLRRQ